MIENKHNKNETSQPKSCLAVEEGSLAFYLSQISDYRKSFGQRFSLLSLLCLIIWGFMSGCTSMRRIAANARNYDQSSDGELSRLLGFKHGTPSHDTLSRAMREIDEEELNRAFLLWIDASFETSGFHLAIDGKAVRASIRHTEGERHPPYVLNVFETGTGKCIAQKQINKKKSEITMVPAIIRFLSEEFPDLIQGYTITTDALSCHKSTFEAVEQAGASYISPVKDNEKELKEYIRFFMEDLIEQAGREAANPVAGARQPNLKRLMALSTQDNKGNRIDRSSYYCAVLEEQEHYAKFPSIELFCYIRRERIENPGKKNCKTSVNDVFYQSTAPMGVQEMADFIRKHWKSETGHFYLDLDMGEDKSTAKKGAALANLSQMRKAALNLLFDADTLCPSKSIKDLQSYFIYNPLKAIEMIFRAAA